MTRADQIAWAAGLFEGEGSITTLTSCEHGNPRVRLRFSMAITDLDVLERFRGAVGCGSICGPYRYDKSTRDIWRWHATKKSEALALAEMFRPYLGERRTVALNAALEAFHSQPPPRRKNWDMTHCKRGHEFTPENTRIGKQHGARHCRSCERQRHVRRRADARADILLLDLAEIS